MKAVLCYYSEENQSMFRSCSLVGDADLLFRDFQRFHVVTDDFQLFFQFQDLATIQRTAWSRHHHKSALRRF